MLEDKLNPIHPGEVLLEEFLKPMNISTDKIAQDLKISIKLIEDIIEEKKGISADIALRLARYFDVSPQFWLGLQMDYDLDVAKDTFGQLINQEVTCSQ
ncbi:HigA family addiction module antitoxin [Geminocystis sp. CENA526]|uniref:HigA family addiction module antitoxin n=1 Tax=Geminocystis sp. CENA526 TaxID=1355871 RepID=UPI003D6F17F0